MPPLVHLGSTFTKILSARTVKISGVPVCDGFCGQRKLTFTALLSSSTCRTHATHHSSAYMHTKPLMSSNASSLLRIETHSTLEAGDSEYALVDIWLLL